MRVCAAIVAWAALATLAALVLIEGVAPPLHRVDTDFPNYFTAAQIVANGGDTARLYDDSWFQAQMRAYGMAAYGKFGPFPPPTALLLVPLARLEPLDALRVVTAVSVLCVGCAIFLLARLLSWRLLPAGLFVLASYHAIVNGLRDGQPYIVISAFCILGYFLYRKNQRLLAGLCFGLFVPLKYYPVIFPLCLALAGEWTVALGSVIAIAAVAVASIAVLGWPVHAVFLTSVIERHLAGRPNPTDPLGLSAAYQSFDSLFGRLFVFDPAANPAPMIAAGALRPIAVAATKAALALASGAVLWRARREARGEARREEGASQFAAAAIGLGGILVMMIAPATATYHFALLWLPVALMVDWLLSRRARAEAYCVLGAYILIGVFPYALSTSFEGHGALSILAYPRLWLTVAMWAACVRAVARGGRSAIAQRAATVRP